MSGNPDAPRLMIASMAHGGRIALLGIPAAGVTLDLNPVIFNMLTLKGSTSGRCTRAGTR
jgi:threonine 3-dehydrogenase